MLDFLIPFFVIVFAELGDKTQLCILALSPKTKKHTQLFFGIMLAFLLTDGLAILLGNILTKYIADSTIKIIAGGIFLVFGILLLSKQKISQQNIPLKNPFATGFGLIFLSEMGDKTQITSGLFATQYNPILVFTAVMLALGLLTFVTLKFGKWICKKTSENIINLIAALLFITIGVVSLINSGAFG